MKRTKRTIGKITEVIRSSRRFLITSHVRLDGDAIGSELALYLMLRDMGKEASVYNRDTIPQMYRFLPGSDTIAWFAAIVGVFLLIAIDNVYAAMARDWFAHLDGQASLLSAAFLVSVLTGNGALAIVTGLLRLYSVIDRMQAQKNAGFGKTQAGWLRIFRVVVGLIVPAFLWLTDGGVSTTALVFVILGEFTDRLDFYDSLDITTPRRSMAMALSK